MSLPSLGFEIRGKKQQFRKIAPRRIHQMSSLPIKRATIGIWIVFIIELLLAGFIILPKLKPHKKTHE